MKKIIIPSLPNYSIDILGRVYKHSGNIDKLLENTFQGSKLIVDISGKSYDIFYLLIEAYCIVITPTDRIKFRINKKHKTLALASIRITKIKEREFYGSPEEKDMSIYGCSRKASNANIRFNEKISAVEIYSVIKTQNFTCYYCDSKLEPDKWQIDHFYSKSHGGKNVFANLVASCECCNRMKHTLDGRQFVKKCVMISSNLQYLLSVHNDPKKDKVI
jgi:hypothetical protein